MTTPAALIGQAHVAACEGGGDALAIAERKVRILAFWLAEAINEDISAGFVRRVPKLIRNRAARRALDILPARQP